MSNTTTQRGVTFVISGSRTQEFTNYTTQLLGTVAWANQEQIALNAGISRVVITDNLNDLPGSLRTSAYENVILGKHNGIKVADGFQGVTFDSPGVTTAYIYMHPTNGIDSNGTPRNLQASLTHEIFHVGERGTVDHPPQWDSKVKVALTELGINSNESRSDYLTFDHGATVPRPSTTTPQNKDVKARPDSPVDDPVSDDIYIKKINDNGEASEFEIIHTKLNGDVLDEATFHLNGTSEKTKYDVNDLDAHTSVTTHYDAAGNEVGVVTAFNESDTWHESNDLNFAHLSRMTEGQLAEMTADISRDYLHGDAATGVMPNYQSYEQTFPNYYDHNTGNFDIDVGGYDLNYDGYFETPEVTYDNVETGIDTTYFDWAPDYVAAGYTVESYYGWDTTDFDYDYDYGYYWPIVLDLNGDGIDIRARNDSDVYINLDDDNFLEQTAWVGATDGLLVIDLASNGNAGADNTISQRKEFTFSDWTTAQDTDAQALKTVFDSNNDGNLTIADTRFGEFRVWQDVNQNGKSETGELKTLTQAGITEVALTTDSKEFMLPDGSIINGLGSFKQNGVTKSYADVALSYNIEGFRKEQGGYITISDNSTNINYLVGLEQKYYGEDGSFKSYFDMRGSNIQLINQPYHLNNTSITNGGYLSDGLLAGIANDTIYAYGSKSVLVNGGAGNDIIAGAQGDDVIDGDTGSDQLYGGAGNDVIYMDKDDNYIDGGFGYDNLIITSNIIINATLRGIGIESIILNNHNDIIDAFGIDKNKDSFGNQSIAGQTSLVGAFVDGRGGNDSILGSVMEDVLVGGLGNDTLQGNGGTDLLQGGEGTDSILGEDGSDVLTGGVGNDILDGGNGNDKLDGGADNDNINGGDGNDTLQGGAGGDILQGGNDNDSLLGDLGDDQLSGDAGNDYHDGEEGNDTVNGGDGFDTLFGGAGNDSIIGGNDVDIIVGDVGTDTLSGGAGDDWIYVDGNDVILGGEGYDRAIASPAVNSLNVNLASSEIEFVFGNAFNDTIDASGMTTGVFINADLGNDIVTGGAGDDVLGGSAGIDQILGGAGDDWLYVDGTDAVIQGGNGYDRMFVEFSTGLVLDLAATSIEFAWGGNGNDIFNASASLVNGYYRGGNGDDLIIGGSGSEWVIGDYGSDIVLGGAGHDAIMAGDDDLATHTNTLSGGAGYDWLYGGRGQDTFVLQGNFDTDRIYGFTHGSDKIKFEYQGLASFSQLGYDYNAGSNITTVWYGGNIAIINDQLTASDFIFA